MCAPEASIMHMIEDSGMTIIIMYHKGNNQVNHSKQSGTYSKAITNKHSLN